MVKLNFCSRHKDIKHNPSIFTKTTFRITAGGCLESLALVCGLSTLVYRLFIGTGNYTSYINGKNGLVEIKNTFLIVVKFLPNKLS